MWAIVPVKPFLRAKSRLAGILSPHERAGLSREFLGHALAVLGQVPSIRQTLVISRDSEALAIARERGVRTVTESGAPDLNAALTRATEAAVRFGARAVLILPTDLPLLTPADVEQMTAVDGDEALVVIVPDRHEKGTNAVFVRPPGLIQYAFGVDSFQEHVRRARSACARVKICRLPGPALDVDLPEDFQLYQTAAASKPPSHEDTQA
jgi:2-phospho-L-lactate guanylyltransferase